MQSFALIRFALIQCLLHIHWYIFNVRILHSPNDVALLGIFMFYSLFFSVKLTNNIEVTLTGNVYQ